MYSLNRAAITYLECISFESSITIIGIEINLLCLFVAVVYHPANSSELFSDCINLKAVYCIEEENCGMNYTLT